MRYTTNAQVIHETIEGETIVIDLSSGSYFSTRGTGSTVWNRLMEGSTVDGVVEGLVGEYGVDAADAEAGVRDFLDSLLGEKLVAPLNGDGAASSPPSGSPVVTSNGGSFAPPKLEKYTDMQDIILLDPVHEVDVRGWPHAN